MPIDLDNAECVHMLSSSEKTLCSHLRIYPKPYLVIKETILKEYARRGFNLKRREARELIKIDVNKTSRIYDFFIEMGWIRPGSHNIMAYFTGESRGGNGTNTFSGGNGGSFTVGRNGTSTLINSGPGAGIMTNGTSNI